MTAKIIDGKALAARIQDELKPPSFNGNSMVEPQTFTADLKGRLRTL